MTAFHHSDFTEKALGVWVTGLSPLGTYKAVLRSVHRASDPGLLSPSSSAKEDLLPTLCHLLNLQCKWSLHTSASRWVRRAGDRKNTNTEKDTSEKEFIFKCTRVAAYRVSLVFHKWKGITQSPQGGRAWYLKAWQRGQGHNQALWLSTWLCPTCPLSSPRTWQGMQSSGQLYPESVLLLRVIYGNFHCQVGCKIQ